MLDDVLELTSVYLCIAEDSDGGDKHKKQAGNPHIELRESHSFCPPVDHSRTSVPLSSVFDRSVGNET